MENKKWYQETFDQVHVPDKLLGKVMDMENQTKAKKGWRYAMGASGTAFALFVASNGICYAATGETWVSRVTIYFNGGSIEKDVTWQDNGDGTFLGTVEMDSDEETGLVMFRDDVDMTNNGTYSFEEDGMTADGNAEYVSSVIDCVVEEDEDGSVWVRVRVREDGVCKAETDITADLADGFAEGELPCGDGFAYHYQVTQTEAGEYELMLSAELSEE